MRKIEEKLEGRLLKRINLITEEVFHEYEYRQKSEGYHRYLGDGGIGIGNQISNYPLMPILKALPALAAANGCVDGIPVLVAMAHALAFDPDQTPISHDNKERILQACRTLEFMGVSAGTSKIADALMNCLRLEDDDIRCAAVSALGMIGEQASTLERIDHVAVLFGKSAELDKAVSVTLSQWAVKAATPKNISDVLSFAYNADEGSRWYACKLLGALGTYGFSPEIYQAILHCLQDANDVVKIAACEAVGNMVPLTVTPEIIQNLILIIYEDIRKNMINAKEENASERLFSTTAAGAACEALAAMGHRANMPEVMNALLYCLQRSEFWSFQNGSALRGILETGNERELNTLLDSLVKSIRLNDRETTYQACKMLSRIGKKAATNEVIKELLDCLRNKQNKPILVAHPQVLEALSTFGERAATAEVFAIIHELLYAKHNLLLFAGIGWTLTVLGAYKTAPEIVNSLIEMCKNNTVKDHTRMIIIHSLAVMGEKCQHEDVITFLAELLNDKDVLIQSCATSALYYLGYRVLPQLQRWRYIPLVRKKTNSVLSINSLSIGGRLHGI